MILSSDSVVYVCILRQHDVAAPRSGEADTASDWQFGHRRLLDMEFTDTGEANIV